MQTATLVDLDAAIASLFGPVIAAFAGVAAADWNGRDKDCGQQS
jgi:hypothetical protein